MSFADKEKHDTSDIDTTNTKTFAQPKPSDKFDGVDLSKYRQPELVEALNRLTSFTYAGSLFVIPAIKIAMRSFWKGSDVPMKELFAKLGGTELNHETEPPRVQVKQSLAQRMIHFIVVGLPLALLVGAAYGVLNLVTNIWSDVIKVSSITNTLFENAKSDLKQWSAHPEQRPSKEKAIDAWSAQIIGPYTTLLLKRKLVGPLKVLAWPASAFVNKFVRRAAFNAASMVETFGANRGFQPFRKSASS